MCKRGGCATACVVTFPGTDVMQRIAALMLGGVTSALLLMLLAFPAIFYIWRGRGLPPAGSVSSSPERGTRGAEPAP